jgi:molybdopterin adenylyltransferase
MKIARLTLSDRASAGAYADLSGPEIERVLVEHLGPEHAYLAVVLPDELDQISTLLRVLCDEEGCDLVVTTGGTGPAPRDVTPEATGDVIEKPMPGFVELMRAVSLKAVPTAILSRQTAGIRGKALIVNLPGNPPAIHDCLMAVFPAIPYCVDLLEGPWLETDENYCKAFRPKHAKKPAP